MRVKGRVRIRVKVRVRVSLGVRDGVSLGPDRQFSAIIPNLKRHGIKGEG